MLAFTARFVLFTFYESPKFLVSRGKDREAVEVVHAVAGFNGAQTGLKVAELEEVDGWFERRERKGEGRRSGEGSGDVEEIEDVEVREEKKKRKGGVAHMEHLKILFGSAAMVRLTVLTWVCYAADYWCGDGCSCFAFITRY